MRQVSKLGVIALLCIALLAIGMVPAMGYTVYSTCGNQNSTAVNGFYNPNSIMKYYNQYFTPVQKYPVTVSPQKPVTQNPVKPPASTVPSNPSTPSTSTPGNSGLTAEESKMVNLVNQERTKQGVKPLGVNMVLVGLARKKSQDMVDRNYFSHTSPTYGSPFDMMKNAGVTYRTAGENIAGAATTESAHQNLMNSSGHRANILNSAFNQVGIGIVSGSTYGNIFTQMFIGQ
jgi:uncharacterized YkwD family protein